MAQPLILEGTADEVAKQLCDSDLTGEITAVIMPKVLPAENGNGRSPEMTASLINFLAHVDQIEFMPDKNYSNQEEQEVDRLIARKFIKQGHTK